MTEPPQRRPAHTPGTSASAASAAMNLTAGSQTPAWVAYDGQVLVYAAYFVEAAMDGRERVRTCVVRYYLEDGTVDVCEPRTDNSGIVQGRLLKRHRAKLQLAGGAGGDALTYHHLAVGRPVVLYGRTYNVIACDAFTREFLAREGVAVAPNRDAPPGLRDEGNVCALLGAIGLGERGLGGRPGTADGPKGSTRADVLLVDPPPASSSSPSGGFEHFDDRRVLRFFCSWDDRGSDGGDLHRYTLNYYLADGTVEVLENLGRNSGRDPFPKMLSRSKLPTNGDFDVGPRPGEGASGPGHGTVTHRDLRIGGEVGVYGRTVKLHDCDESTRAFYVKEMGRTLAEMAPAPLPEDVPRPPPPAPPHNGFGSETDSLRNCHSLVPRPPKLDFRHWEANDGKTLRFTAQFAESPSVVPPNDERRFVITLYLVDNTVSVFEPPMRNSGIVGGKFLERTMEPVRKPDSRAPYTARDFVVGNSLTIHSHTFTLLTTDAATERLIRELAN